MISICLRIDKLLAFHGKCQGGYVRDEGRRQRRQGPLGKCMHLTHTAQINGGTISFCNRKEAVNGRVGSRVRADSGIRRCRGVFALSPPTCWTRPRVELVAREKEQQAKEARASHGSRGRPPRPGGTGRICKCGRKTARDTDFNVYAGCCPMVTCGERLWRERYVGSRKSVAIKSLK